MELNFVKLSSIYLKLWKLVDLHFPGHHWFEIVDESEEILSKEIKQILEEDTSWAPNVEKLTSDIKNTLALVTASEIVPEEEWFKNARQMRTYLRDEALSAVDKIMAIYNSDVEESSMYSIHRGRDTVLVIEDEEELRERVKADLVSNGYNVLTANNGNEAVGMYEHRQDIALILSDIEMPKPSWQDSLEKFKNINPNVIILRASNYPEPNINFESIEKAREIIRKPYTPNKILRKIREELDRN